MAKPTAKKGAGAPEQNTNAEKWTENEAISLLSMALTFSNIKEEVTKGVMGYKYDFIGEIARDLNSYHHIFKYLAGKYASCNEIHKQLLSNLEANCFYNSKRGNIREATAIVNLKSNYNWTDRQQTDVTSGGEKIQVVTGFEVK